MKRHLSATCAAMALTVLCGGALAHPLDGLSKEEIAEVVTIMKSDDRISDEARFPLIELKEPEKAEVLAWKEGDEGPRAATVHVISGDETYKAEVNLVSGEISDFGAIGGQHMVLLEEFIGAMDLALSDENFVAALAKRDLEPGDVFCLPLTAGSFDREAEAGQRLMKVPCYVNPTGSNFYAKPIEGLYAVVDLAGKSVVEVIDNGVVPVPQDAWGYMEDEVEARTGALRPESNPATLRQEGDPNFTIDGSMVNWDIWRFRWRVDKRPGVVLSNIEVNDRGDWRSVLYQAHLSEVFVPYMDPDEGWYWRTYMDSGEYGFGIFLSPLRAGVDCPAYARFLPATVHDDLGNPIEIPNALCIFERNIGDPAWRHYEIFAQSEEQSVPAEGRPASELVVRSASQVGNYDYLIDYVFEQNGRIRVMVGATGLDAVKGVASTSMEDATAEQETRYGTLIVPNLVAPNHDHFFNFRLDFDIDGQDNVFMRTGLVKGDMPDGVPRRSMWVTEATMPKTEMEARYRVNPATPAMYHIMNMGRKIGVGHAPGYMILPQNSVAYSPLDTENDPPAKRNAYIDYTFWNTPYAANERYAGGEYAFQSDGSDTLAEWVKQDRSIDNTDIVTWYTMGFHHVPQMEDWPVMSTMWKGITLKPYNFFPHNPALTVRLPE